MPPEVTVVIPVERGREWDKRRIELLPPGTPYIVADYDEGEWADAVNMAVAHADTPLCILSAPDVEFQRQPNAVDFLSGLAWDVDVTWGPMVLYRDGEPVAVGHEGAFCPNRLTRENYINPVLCVRKESFQRVGGVKTGLWDLQLRLHAAGGKFKYVPEATAARDGQWIDLSEPPAPVDVKATFYHQATTGTTYWRCQLPARFLPGQTIFNLPFRGERDGKAFLPNHAGTAVFQYAGDAAHHVLTKFIQEEGGRVLIEVDDDYTHWHKTVMKAAGWVEKASDCPPEGGYSVEGHLATVGIADGVTVTTERLAKMYRPLNKNVYVCPNQIDPADWPELKKPDDGKFRIGWFASGSHRDDGRLIVRAMEWASRQPDVEIVLIGLGVSNGKPWYKFPFMHYAWSNDLGVYKQFLLNLDVGLCPVVPTPWAVCRSDLKALEYAMAGAVPFVSDVPPYEGLGIPGVVHCPDEKAFLRAVQWAVRNRDEVRQLAGEARDYVLEHRTVEANIDRWREAVAQE